MKKPKRTVAHRETTRRKSVSRRRQLRIPPLLFEGDRPAPPPLSGPGEKFALGKHPKARAVEIAELPETYGTGRLFVTTRDPHWLYAHWDFTREQQRRYNTLSVHGHLVLRTYIGTATGAPASEIHVHPESRYWFAHVERAATEYVAELGFYRRGHKWTRLATSAAMLTPPDTISSDTTSAFATIPFDTPFEELLSEVHQSVEENIPLAQALEELRQHGEAGMPVAAAESSPWTPEQERTLAEAIRTDTSPCAWMDSLAITELIQGRFEQEISSPGAAAFGFAAWPAGFEEAMFSRVEGFSGGGKGFWFSVNTELIIYGATEHDATVTIGGRRITLRPDGTFSHRFALPDGQYTLNVAAVSADGTERRAVELKFVRATECVGDVGTHPQEPGMLPPASEDV